MEVKKSKEMPFPSIQIFKLTSRVPEESKPFVLPHGIKSCNHPNIKGPDFLSLSATITIKLYCLKTTAKCLHRTETWKQRSLRTTCKNRASVRLFQQLLLHCLSTGWSLSGCKEQQRLTYGALTLCTNVVWLLMVTTSPEEHTFKEKAAIISAGTPASWGTKEKSTTSNVGRTQGGNLEDARSWVNLCLKGNETAPGQRKKYFSL